MQPALMVVGSRIGWLGQAKAPVTLRLLVKDFKDRGFTGVKWTVVRRGIGEMPISGETNGNGTSVVTFDTMSPQFDVQVELPEGVVSKPMKVEDAAHEVMTLRSVEEAPQALFNTTEIVAGGSGITLFLVGLFTGITPIERIGEVLIVATAFTRVGRAV